ncbi:MAG: polyprenyl synthetase family protein [Halanaerobacter sp.]
MSWNRFKSIGSELDKFEDYLYEVLESKQLLVKNAVSNLVQSGGKRVRPALIITIAHLGDYKEEQVWNFAAVIEILHMAALIHDDIIDDSNLRRGSQTVQSEYGKDTAVFTGDYLFSLAFNLLSDQANKEQLKRVTEVINKICEGEIQQHQNRYDYSISYKDYFYRIKCKTALLFETSCILGGETAGFKVEKVKRLAQYGLYLGMAFQLTDDLLDFKEDTAQLGKPATNDLINGIYTLPLLYIVKEKDDAGYLKNLLEKTEVNRDEIKEIVIKNGGLDYTLNIAKRYMTKARRRLDGLAPSSYKDILLNLTEKIVNRNF